MKQAILAGVILTLLIFMQVMPADIETLTSLRSGLRQEKLEDIESPLGGGYSILSFTYSSTVSIFIGKPLTLTFDVNTTSSLPLYAPFAAIILHPNLTLLSVELEDIGTLTPINLGAIPSSGYLEYKPGRATIRLTGDPGYNAFVVQIPLNNVQATGEYPAVNVRVSINPGVNLEDLYPLNYTLIYYLGQDPLDNPGSDPPVTEYSSIVRLIPTPLSVNKVFTKISGGFGDWASEDTIPAGSNYIANFTVTLDIAEGYLFQELNFTDAIPLGFNVTGVYYQVYAATSLTLVSQHFDPLLGGGWFNISLYNVTGVAGPDVVVKLQGHAIPGVLNCYSELNISNQVYVRGLLMNNYTNNTLYPEVSGHVNVTIKHLTIEKGVELIVDGNASGVTPGDVLEYTLYVEVADFSNITSAIINDTLGDGLTVDRDNPPEVLLCIAGTCLPEQPLNPGEYLYYPDHSGVNGTTTLIFNLTRIVERITGYTNLSGGGLLGGGPTYLYIEFNASVDDNFSSTTPGDISVSANDVLFDDVSVEGVEGLCSINVSDSSSASVRVPRPSIYKSLVYINGVPVTGPTEAYVGDNLTYNITVIIPPGDIDQLEIEDLLPRPVLDATQITTQHIGPPPPPPGSWMIGPNDNLTSVTGIVPTLTVNSILNSIKFTYGNVSIQGTKPLRIEILYTVTVQDRPFDDPLPLINLLIMRYENSFLHRFEGATLERLAVARAPEIVVEKWIVKDGNLYKSRGGLDAWDRVDFMINVTNIGGSEAYNLSLNDTINQLNPAIWARNISNIVVYLSNGTILANTTDYLLLIKPNSSYPGSFNLTLYRPLPAGMSLLINFTINIYENVTTGSTYWNRVKVTNYSATPNGANFVDPADPPRDKVRIKIRPPQVVSKKVVWSQEDFTGKIISGHSEPQVVTIGEVIIYEINVSIPEGLTRNLIVEDWLPALYNSTSEKWDIILVEYLNESNITVDDPGVTASNATLIAGVWVSVDGIRLYPNIIQYRLMDIINSNNDSDQEIISIRFRAIVLNRPENHAGVWPWNGAVVGFLDARDRWKCPQCNNPPYAQVIIHEANLTAIKSANTTILGVYSGWVGFNFTLHNNKSFYSGPAFDIRAVDTMPAGLILDTASISVYLRNSTGVFPLSFTSYSSTSILNITVNLSRGLLPGESIHVYYNAMIDPDSVLHGTTLNNTAYYVSSSIPGLHGTGNHTPGDPGTLFGERVYNTTSSLLLAVPPLGLEKYADKDTATIGENATYTINITVPMGTSINTIVIDELDPGTQFIGLNSCVIVGSGITVEHCPPLVTLLGTQLKLSLGNITKSTPGYGYIVINYTVRILDSSGISAGYIIRNNATIYYNNNSAGPASSSIKVVEPILSIVKTTWPDSVINNTNPVAWFNISLRNSLTPNSSTAYDIVLSDIVPHSLIVLNVIHTYSGAANVTLYWTGNNITLTADSLDPGGYINISIMVTAYSMTPVNITINNTVNATGSSLPGDVTGERVYNLSSWSTLTYTTSFGVDKLVDDVLPDKAYAGDTTSLPPGGYALYMVNITLPLGLTTWVNLTDPLAPGLSYIPGSLNIVLGPGVTVGSLTTSTSPIAVYMHNVSINQSQSYILVTYMVQVSNGTSNGDILINTASVSTKDGSNNTHTISDSTRITIVEPDLIVYKVFEPVVITHYDVYSNITINITNMGNTEAYDVILEDLVPDTILVEDAVILEYSNAAGITLYRDGNNITLIADQIGVSGYIVIEVRVRAYAGTPWNATIINSAQANYTSLPGDVEGEKHYSSTGAAILLYDPILEGVKDMEPRVVNIGEVIDVTINITVPPGYTSNLTIVDNYDPAMSLVSGPSIIHSPNITTSPPIVSFAPHTLIIYLGHVANNATQPENITIKLQVRIDNPSHIVRNGSLRTVYFNNATIYWIDDGLEVSRSLNSTANVTLPAFIGGEAEIMVYRHSKASIIIPVLIAVGVLSIMVASSNKFKNKNRTIK